LHATGRLNRGSDNDPPFDGGAASRAAVIDGLVADVVTLALAYTSMPLPTRPSFSQEWQSRLPKQQFTLYFNVFFWW
jgi:ABC-type sulfate transport system substrate-binding protein